MGITIRDSHVKEEPDKGWAGPALRERVYSRILPDIREGLLPEWNRAYTVHRLMIDGIVDEQDISVIHDKVKQLSSFAKQ